MMAFIIQWPLMSEAPWRSIQISVYIESQAGNMTGALCSLITRGDMPEMGMSTKITEQLPSSSPH